MRTGMKLFLIAVVVFGGAILNLALKESLGIGFGAIFNMALIAAAIAIWRYNPDNKNNNSK